MKSYKELCKNIVKSLLQEDAGEHTMGGSLNTGALDNGSAATNFGSYRIEEPKAFRAVQAFLSNYSNKPVLEPESLLAIIKTKMNILGLDFKWKGNVLNDGVNDFPLFQYASPGVGVLGGKPSEDMNKRPLFGGDGISERAGHSMTFRVVCTQIGGKTSLDMTIIPQGSEAPQSPAPNAY